MAGNRTLKLNILAETKDLVDGLKKADNATSTAGSKISGAFKAVGVAALAAGAAAGAFAVKLAVDGVKAAIEDEAAQVRLATALKNTTGATNEQIAAIEQQILKTSLATGIADDQLRPALSRLSIATGDTAKAQELLNLSLDISASTGKDLDSVTQALGKAYEGNTTSLSRLGVGLGSADIKALGLEGTVAQLAETFGGAAAAQANTFEGQVARLNVAFDEAKETIGAALLPVLTQMLDFIVQRVFPIVQGFADSFDKNASPAIEKLKDIVVKFVIPALQNLWTFIKDFIVPTIRNILSPVIEILQAAFVFLSNKVQENREAFETAAAIMLKIFEFVRDKLAPVVGNVLATAFNIITRAIGLAIDNFGRVFDIINKVARFLGFDFSLEVDKATKTVNNLDSGIVDAYKSFSEQSRVVKQEVIPSLNSVVTAQNSVAASTTRTTAAINEQTRASEALARIQKKLADDPTGEKAVAAARAARGTGERISLTERQRLEALATSGTLSLEEESRLVAALTGSEYDPSTTGRYVARLSDLLDVGLGGVSSKIIDEALIGLVKEGLLTPGINGQPTYQPAGGGSLGELVAGRVNQINININGTVVNPEGTARAITNVLQNSNARSGVGVLTPVLGLE